MADKYRFEPREAKYLEKFHTRVNASESDSDSENSWEDISEPENSLEYEKIANEMKPPIISYDVIMSKGIEIGPDGSSTKTIANPNDTDTTDHVRTDISEVTNSDNNSLQSSQPEQNLLQDVDQIIEENLRTKTLSDYCHICTVNLGSPGNSTSHYNSKRHHNKVEIWTIQEKCKLEITERIRNTQNRINSSTDSESMLDSIVDASCHSIYCHICSSNLTRPSDAMNHYNSNRHKNNVATWREREKQKFMSYVSMDLSFIRNPPLLNTNQLTTSDYNNAQANVTVDQIIERKLQIKTPSEYCYICNADLGQPTNSINHYNSFRHASNKEIWEKEQRELLRIPEERLLEQKLYHETSPEYCCICSAKLVTPMNSRSHYNSQRHEDIVTFWKEQEKKKINKSDLTVNKQQANNKQPKQSTTTNTATTTAKTTAATTAKTIATTATTEKLNINSDVPLSKILEKKLQIKTPVHYCYICQSDLSQRINSIQHYNSNRHKINVEYWKEQEKIDIPIEKIVEKKLIDKTPFHYCFICSANLENEVNSRSHYNSQRHANNVKTWKEQEKKKIKKPAVSNPAEVKQKTNNELSKTSRDPVNPNPKTKPNVNNVSTTNSTKQDSKVFQKNLFDSYCSLCSVVTTTSAVQNAHYNSKKHKQKYDNWQKSHSQQPSSSNTTKVSPSTSQRSVKVVSDNSSSTRKVTESTDNKQSNVSSNKSLLNNSTNVNKSGTVQQEKREQKGADGKTPIKQINKNLSAINARVELKLKKQCLLNECLLCQKKFDTPNIANEHYQSQLHADKCNEFCVIERKIIKYGAEEFQKKLDKEMLPNSCLVCRAFFELSGAGKHYKSVRHHNNLLNWKRKELGLMVNDNSKSESFSQMSESTSSSDWIVPTNRSEKNESNLDKSEVTNLPGINKFIDIEKFIEEHNKINRVDSPIRPYSPISVSNSTVNQGKSIEDATAANQELSISKSSSEICMSKLNETSLIIQKEFNDFIDLFSAYSSLNGVNANMSSRSELCIIHQDRINLRIQNELYQFTDHIHTFIDRFSTLLTSGNLEELKDVLSSCNRELKSMNKNYESQGKSNVEKNLTIIKNVTNIDEDIKSSVSVNSIVNDSIISNSTLVMFTACAAIFWIYVLLNTNSLTAFAMQIIFLCLAFNDALSTKLE